MANLESNLLRIERALLEGCWKSGAYTEIALVEPKRRMFLPRLSATAWHITLCMRW